MAKRKQISFDIDTNVTKKIFGEQGYTKVYADIRRFLEKEDWKHIEGSVYMSGYSMDNGAVVYTIRDMIRQYPYLDKCIKEIHQADISNVHSLNQYFSYDGTPGQYERAQYIDRQQREPPKRPSVYKQLEKNKAAIEEKEKDQNSKERASPHHKRDDLLR